MRQRTLPFPVIPIVQYCAVARNAMLTFSKSTNRWTFEHIAALMCTLPCKALTPLPGRPWTFGPNPGHRYSKACVYRTLLVSPTSSLQRIPPLRTTWELAHALQWFGRPFHSVPLSVFQVISYNTVDITYRIYRYTRCLHVCWCLMSHVNRSLQLYIMLESSTHTHQWIFVAHTLVNPPRKLHVFVVQNNFCWIKLPPTGFVLFWKQNHWHSANVCFATILCAKVNVVSSSK